MNFILDIPRFKCWVWREFLTDGRESGLTEAYAFAVTLLESRPLFFTVHTIDGAVYSRLPIWALRHKEIDLATDAERTFEEHDLTILDPWGAISSHAQVIAHQYLKDYWIVAKVGASKINGRYLFTIDYSHGGFAQDPEQHKTSNIIALKSGHFAALPNNMCLFLDRHFTEGADFPKGYRRNRTYYLLG